MRYEILNPGSYAMVRVLLEKGESIRAEAGAMVAMSDTLDIEGKADGGFLKGLGRMLSGESFFFQHVRAERGGGEVLLAPPSPGDVRPIELDGSEGYIVQKEGFLAGAETLDVSTTMQNLSKGLLSGEGFFVVRVGGRGPLFVASFGAIHRIDIPAGREMVIDNGHLVAWQESARYEVVKASKGWFSSVTTGEMLVCRFRGPGAVYVQSRNPRAFGSWIHRFLPATGG